MSDSKESSKSNVVVSNTLSANDKELLFGSQNFSGELLSQNEMEQTTGEWGWFQAVSTAYYIYDVGKRERWW